MAVARPVFNMGQHLGSTIVHVFAVLFFTDEREPGAIGNSVSLYGRGATPLAVAKPGAPSPG